jgi:glycerol kinase
MQAGVYPDMAGFAESWAIQRRFEPRIDETTRARKYDAWKTAVAATMSM